MVQKAVRSEASSPNSLGPNGDWPEVRGEVHHPRTVLSWQLAKWVVGESEEAGLALGAAVDGASRRAGCAGPPRSAAVPLRTAGQSPRRCHRTAPPGRWGHRESVPCRRPSSLPG